MPLAGRMKRTTFLTIAGCLGALGVAGAVLFGGGEEEEPPIVDVDPLPIEDPAVVPLVADPTPEVTPEPAAQTEGGPWGADVVTAIRSAAELSPVSGKAKDLSGGLGIKVNVYRDAGQAENNRAKLDLDRDEKWDIKLDFEPGKVVAHYAPADDEAYTETWISLAGGPWRQEGAEPEAVPVEPMATPSMDPVDLALMKWVGQDLGTTKIKDATKGQPFKINVYQDAGNASANRAKIDLDRDDRWDIKVTFEQLPSRQLSPQDNEDYSVSQVWNGEAWE